MDQPNRRWRMALGVLLSVGVVFTLSLSFVLAQTPMSAPAQGVGLPAIIPAAQEETSFVSGVVLVQFEPGTAMSRAHDLAASFPGARDVEALSAAAGIYRIMVDAGSELDLASRWTQDARVRVAEPDYLFYTTAIPNDPLYPRYQWNLRHLRAEQGWDRTTGNSQIVIAVIDTGVDLTHPDLANKIVPGYDFVNNDADPADDQGHGTHVASIAAANSNNEQGIAGVAWGARIMPIKALDANGAGRSSDVAQAITWAVDHRANIINLSLGGSTYSDLVAAAIQDAHERGVLVIAAAGNHYLRGNPIIYPAAYNHVLAVAAIDDQDGHASYASSGSYIDVAAPGGDPSGSLDDESRHWIPGAYWRGSGISYAWLSGTSQAAPHVAGLAALLLSFNSGLTPDQLTSIIVNTAVDVQSLGWDEFSGYGRIDIPAALDVAQTVATRTPTPTATWTATPTPSATPLPPALLRPRQDQRINSSTANHQADAALVEDGQGNLTTIWRDGRNGNDALYSAHLPAAAVDWGANLLVTGTQQRSHVDAISPPFLAGAPDGTVHAVWRGQSGSDNAGIYYSRQGQSGAAWNEPRRIDNESAANRAHPVLAVTSDGRALVVWEEKRGGMDSAAHTEIYWSERQPENDTWSAPTPIRAGIENQSEAALAAGPMGVYAAWVYRAEEAAVLMVARKNLWSGAWSEPLVSVPLDPKVDAYTPAIVVDSQGAVTLAWADQRTAASGLDIFTTRQGNDQGAWSAITRVNDDSGASDQRHPRLAASDQGLVLAWEDDRLGDPDIFVAWQTSGSPTWSPNRRANQDGSGIIQRTPDIVMDDAGHTTLVWTDYRTGNTAPEIYTRFIPFAERFSVFLPTVTGR